METSLLKGSSGNFVGVKYLSISTLGIFQRVPIHSMFIGRSKFSNSSSETVPHSSS